MGISGFYTLIAVGVVHRCLDGCLHLSMGTVVARKLAQNHCLKCDTLEGRSRPHNLMQKNGGLRGLAQEVEPFTASHFRTDTAITALMISAVLLAA